MPPDLTETYTYSGPGNINRQQKHDWMGWRGRGWFVGSCKIENRRKINN